MGKESQTKIVIADTGYEMLTKQLMARSEEFNILYATDDGSKIYDTVCESKPDILLIDVFISKVDGLEVVEQIRANEELNNTKILFLSTVGSPRIINMAFSLGADYYIMKPCSPDIIVKRIIQMMNMNKKLLNEEEDDDMEKIHEKPDNNSIESEVTTIIRDLGIPAHIKGYQYIREGIIMIYNNPEIIGGIAVLKMENPGHRTAAYSLENIDVQALRNEYN